jgi:hypothetical protein
MDWSIRYGIDQLNSAIDQSLVLMVTMKHIASGETVYSNHDTEIGDSNDRQEIDSEQESIVTPQRSSRSSSIFNEQCSDMIEEDEQVERACGRLRRRCSRCSLFHLHLGWHCCLVRGIGDWGGD